MEDKQRLADEAKRILSEPMVRDFFIHQKQMCFEAMESMPLGASLDEYQTVYHDLRAVKKLETTLKGYIENYDNFRAEESREDVDWI